jgi:hypothetical protein
VNAPASVKAAAALFVVYGLAVLLNATVMQRSGGWFAGRSEPWVLIQLIVAGVIAAGLVRRAPWAWWLGVALGAIWLVSGALAVLVVEHGDVYWLPPSGFQSLLVGSLGLLGVAVALLLSPSARKAFRRPAG